MKAKILLSLSMLVCMFLFVQAQNQQMRTIYGKVTDAETGEPLPFINIFTIINGTLTGTNTDFDGLYSLEVPNNIIKLTFSYVGYKRQIVFVAPTWNELDVALQEEAELLQAVEVISYSTPTRQAKKSKRKKTMARQGAPSKNYASPSVNRGPAPRPSPPPRQMRPPVPTSAPAPPSAYIPLNIPADKTSTGSTLTKEDIANLPTREVGSIASQAVSVQNSKDSDTDYYVDDIKVEKAKKNNMPRKYIKLLAKLEEAKGEKLGQKKQEILRKAYELEQPILQKEYELAQEKARKLAELKQEKARKLAEERNKLIENHFESIKTDPLSTFSIDVDKAAYTNMRSKINNSQKPRPNDIRIEEMINYFQYDYPQPKSGHPFSVSVEMADCPWESDHYLALVGLQGKTLTKKDVPAQNLTFLLDVSGSMNASDKLPLLKEGFKLLVNELTEKDRVSIVVYAGAAGEVLPPTAGNNKKAIFDALNSLQAGGSTAGGAGIKLAYKLAKQNFIENGNNRVILATDGDFNVGVSSNDGLVKLIEEKRKTGIFLSILGFGSGNNYQDAKMEKLSNHGNGNYAFIDNIKEAEKVLVKEMYGTLNTIAKDVKLQIEFNPKQVAGYRLIGYVNRVLAAEDFNDDTKDAGEMGAGHSVTALYEIVPTGNKLPKNATKIADKKDNTDKNKKAIEKTKPDYDETKVDALKYQKDGKMTEIAEKSSEVFTVKMRYKEPNEETSKKFANTHYNKKFEQVLKREDKMPIAQSSENLRFATSVSMFGMLLQDSQYKGKSSFSKVEKLAEKAKGKDTENYRKEFVELVKKASNLYK
ncbi:MAG: YfbK domain-containing protein [Chitinophagales bacterium]